MKNSAPRRPGPEPFPAGGPSWPAGTFGRESWPAYVVLVCAVLLTGTLYYSAKRVVESDERERFERIVMFAREATDRRIGDYVQLLRSTAALFAASESVERREFRAFAEAVDVQSRYPGLIRLGYAVRVPGRELARHVTGMRREGVARYTVKPAGERVEYFPIIYVEPRDETAEGALGYDPLAEPLRRAAMEQARDSARPVVTERLVLLTDSRKGEPPAGLVIFVPVYRGGVAPDTVAGRRAALQGFVYGSFHAAEMLQAIFGGQLAPGVDLEVYEGKEPSRDRLLFDQNGVPNAVGRPGRGELSRRVTLQVPGRTWTLYLSTLPEFHRISTRYTPLGVLAGGLLVSALAFGAALSLARARASAERIMADRRGAEERLREANERFELAAAAVLGAIYDWDLERDTAVFTEGLTEVFGYTEVVHTFAWWLERVHPADRDKIYDPRRASAGEPLVAEYRFRASDGRYLDVWDRGRAVRDASGRVVRVVGSMLNITDRKRAEAASRAVEARDRAILESSLDAVIAADHEGRITEFNPAAERIFGHSRAAAVGQELASLIIPPSLRDRHRRGLARYLATGEAVVLGQRCELTALRADGTEFPVELTVSRIPVEGPPVFTAFLRDISERKAAEKAKANLEEQLRQAQKMEAVGRLAGGVAHDFNNLLTVISGRVHLLLSRLKPGDPLHRDAELIQKTTQRAVALTGQLLAFSRKQVLQPRVLDLNQVAAGMEPLLRRLIGEDVELVIAPAPGLGRVKADPGQLEQVVMNLAINARDAMPRGGRFTIATRNADVDEAAAGEVNLRPGDYVALSVTDTGTGMTPEIRSQIFEPFFTTKEPGKGTGLGLSTVYGVVEQSGGGITVDSEPGRGTTFTIYLPRVEEAVEAAAPAEAPRTSPSTAKTVLLVDDEPEVRELAGEILRRVGYTLLEAGSGEEALSVADRHGSPIHLLVTDMMMPGMNGRELAERLRGLRPRLPVLYISGYVKDADARAALFGKQSAFVSKPFTPETLTEKVRELLATAAPA